MNELKIVWDQEKARQNIRKHGVSFEEAGSVFYDENALEFFDPDHSQKEDRFILLGLSFKMRILVVCHCSREHSMIRIISARKATRQEAQTYEGGKQ